MSQVQLRRRRALVLPVGLQVPMAAVMSADKAAVCPEFLAVPNIRQP